MRHRARFRIVSPFLLALGLVTVLTLPTSPSVGVAGVSEVRAANPNKTPPAKGKPTPTPQPTPTPIPKPTSTTTPAPSPTPTPQPTPTSRPTAPATARPTSETATPTPTPPTSRPGTPTPSPSAVPFGLGGTGVGAGPDVSPSQASPVGATGSSDQGGGSGLGFIAFGLIGGGGVFLVLYGRRRRRQPDEPRMADDQRSLVHLEVLADPLLEAMASSARAAGGRGGSKKGPQDGHPPVATWVKRLDAEINVLADLRDVPSPPPHEQTNHHVGDRSISA